MSSPLPRPLKLFLLGSLQLCLQGQEVLAFGKYLQTHIARKEGGAQTLQVKTRRNDTDTVVEDSGSSRVSDGGDLYRELMSGSPSARQAASSLLHKQSGRSAEVDDDGLEIEIVAGILIASIFAVFICIYTVLLQCWWRCRDRKYPSWNKALRKGKKNKSRNRKSKTGCSCFTQLTWEPVDDLEKHLIEECSVASVSSGASTSCSSASATSSGTGSPSSSSKGSSQLGRGGW